MKLYKYMSCNEESMKRVENLIQYGWLSFSSPSRFDDLFEKKLRANDKDLFEREKHQQHIDAELACRRVLCLSETNNSHVMWHYYADSCKGVCIEIDVNNVREEKNIELPLESNYHRAPIFLRRIQYLSMEEKRKKQDDLIEQDDIDECLFMKTIEWSFEKEWRAIVKTTPESADFISVKLMPNAVTGVFMGPYINPNAKMHILRICHTGRFNIPTFIKQPEQAQFMDYFSVLGTGLESEWRVFE